MNIPALGFAHTRWKVKEWTAMSSKTVGASQLGAKMFTLSCFVQEKGRNID